MTTNPFESIEHKLQSLQSQVDTLTELLRETLHNSNQHPPAETTDGIELAMEVTGLAKGTVYNLAAERKIPHYKCGKRIYFNRKELQDWIQAGKRLTRDELTKMYEGGRIKQN
jgi:excisionase family DNA binding protein